MKYVLAFIAPDLLNRVRESLVSNHIHGLTASSAEGFGQEHDLDHPEHRDYPGVEMTDKLRLEIFCHDDELESVLAAIYSAAHTGHRGDGKVFVLPVLDGLRLKTGERGDAAIGPAAA